MKSLLLVLLCVAAAVSGSQVKKVVETKVSYGKTGHGYGHKAGYVEKGLYHGQYPGKCGNDGFYYNDYSSFVICSNGNAYIQACAPGSKNSAHSNYAHGNSYYYRDFCDVNLVDDGYAAYQGHGYAAHGVYGAIHGAAYGRGANFGYGQNAGYGQVAHQGAYGYGRNHYGQAGYGTGASYQKTEYTKEYGTQAKTH